MKDTALAYRQFAALGASPVEQVVALYDGIIRDFHTCIAGISAGQIEKRVKSSNHALTIIGELQGVLDFAQGGDVARNLNHFYNVTRPMVVQASMANSSEKFQELIGMYSRIRAAWAHVASTLPASASEPGDRPRHPRAVENIATSRAATRNKASKKVPGAQPDAENYSTGRWSA
jgi:flagellar secretion chaperone FliS